MTTPTPPARPLRLAVLASGRGSNLLCILEAIAGGRLAAEVVGVFSDKPQAPALEHARAAGIHTCALAARGFASRELYDEQLFSRIDAVQPDLIVCAGYMRLISDAAVAARTGRMINIHPSLLPAFKGLRTHQQALDAGVDLHGASVHYVTPELDGGPVIAQARVAVQAGDDADALAARVLRREHPLLVAALALIGAGRVALEGGEVVYDGHRLAAPLQLDESNQLQPGTHA